MPTNLAKIVIPTGFEHERRDAERKRAIAEALMKNGMAVNPNMNSWSQVAGQIANAWAGKRLDKKATKMDDAADEHIRSAYTEGLKSLYADATAGKSAGDIVQAHQGDPLMSDALAPYVKAQERQLTEAENKVKFGGRMRRAGDIGSGEYDENVNDSVVHTPDGRVTVNMPKAVAGMAAQGMVPLQSGQTDIYTTTDPTQSPAGLPATQAAGGPAGGGNDVLSAFNPEELKVITAEAMRRRQTGAAPQNIPSGNPLGPGSNARPPAGVTKDGKPFWVVNGVPYDNPEGK